MAKHLFIIRHAKSDWSFDVRDFERPLNARGFKNAPQMALRLAQYSVLPQHLVSSPAKRAITTAQIFAEHLKMPVKNIQTDNRMYEAALNTLFQIINELDDRHDSVALFGHNPSFTLLTNYFADENVYNIPTCGIVHLRFDDAEDWASLSEGTGKLAWFAYPRDGE
ncbi:SixA phosphatase family protein [Parapedobacter tibetensis]|uniref:SixA phosphatase family protein n=1 Tax=Parapedobacter tibetensis TaxID=2972951 RepID=UPI00214D9ECF|nr:histidine phosphatase family protein [Parapedobacter tibetensis]